MYYSVRSSFLTVSKHKIRKSTPEPIKTSESQAMKTVCCTVMQSDPNGEVVTFGLITHLFMADFSNRNMLTGLVHI